MEIASLLKNRELQLKLGTWGTDYSSEVNMYVHVELTTKIQILQHRYVHI